MVKVIDIERLISPLLHLPTTPLSHSSPNPSPTHPQPPFPTHLNITYHLTIQYIFFTGILIRRDLNYNVLAFTELNCFILFVAKAELMFNI